MHVDIFRRVGPEEIRGWSVVEFLSNQNEWITAQLLGSARNRILIVPPEHLQKKQLQKKYRCFSTSSL